MKKISLAIILAFSALACAQTTTTVTGTIKDLSNAVVTSGQVTFTLKPGADTTISGTARFSPSTVTCTINGSGLVKAADGLSVCTLVNNTALTPAGTYYQVCIQPQFVTPGSCFNWYALGTSTDITTVVPTPGTAPAFTFVDTYSNQTVAGNKTFTGTTTFSGSFGVGALTASSLGINALGTATSGANFNSGNAVWNASIWNGSIATPDAFTWKNVAGTGANPSVAWTLTHSGSSGSASVNFGGIKLVDSNINGFIYVDGVNYTTLQQAVTSACSSDPHSMVLLPPGSYTANSALTLCSRLIIQGSGSGQGDAATCPTTITTTLTSGILFDETNLNDIHIRDLCITDLGAAGTTTAIMRSSSQRNAVENVYIYGPFLVDMEWKSSSTAASSTIWNNDRNIHATGGAAGGTCFLFDSTDASAKVINGNTGTNMRCTSGAGGFCLKVTNSGVHNQVINDNWLQLTQCTAPTGTAVQFDQGSTRGFTLAVPNIEGSTNGFVKQTANTVGFQGGNISSNGTNVTDAQAGFTLFEGGTNVGGVTQNRATTPAGGGYFDGLGIGGAAPVSNSINGNGAWNLDVSGAAQGTVNNSTPILRPASGKNISLLNVQNNLSPIVGTAADATFFTWAIPAGIVPTGSAVRISFWFSHSTGTAAVNYRFKIGSTTITNYGSPAGTGTFQGAIILYNQGSGLCTKIDDPLITSTPSLQSTPGYGAGNTCDFSAGFTVNLTMNVANTDQITPQFWMAEIIQ